MKKKLLLFLIFFLLFSGLAHSEYAAETANSTDLKKDPLYQKSKNYLTGKKENENVKALNDITPEALKGSPFQLIRTFTQNPTDNEKAKGTDSLVVNEKIFVKPIALPGFIQKLQFKIPDEATALGIAQIYTALNSNLFIFKNTSQLSTPVPYDVEQQLTPPIVTKTDDGFQIILFTIYSPATGNPKTSKQKITKHTISVGDGFLSDSKKVIY